MGAPLGANNRRSEEEFRTLLVERSEKTNCGTLDVDRRGFG